MIRTRKLGVRKLSVTLITALIATSVFSGASFAASKSPKPKKPKIVKLATSDVVRIGFFSNVTHAPALVAQERKFFEKYLDKDKTKIEYIAFNAGPAAIEALKGGALDVTYIGPNPSISGFASTRGTLLKIISGSTSNGAQLVVREGINSVADFAGKKIASPQLGNTQDVALRSWLASNGFKTSINGVGDVTVIPTENSQTLALFQRGDIDGAWLPEPWASRLVLEAKAKVFLDEKILWPNSKFLTTNIIASSTFLAKYPGTVKSILKGHLDSLDFINKNTVMAKDDVQKQITKWSGKPLADNVINRSWLNLGFSYEPLAATLSKSADDAVDAGLLTNLGSKGLSGIYDLALLNQILKEGKKKSVTSDGLGKE